MAATSVRPSTTRLQTLIARARLARERGALTPRELLAVLWTSFALFAVAQIAVYAVVTRSFARVTPWQNVVLVILWALAAPLIVASARRFPIGGDARTRHLVRHAVSASAFIVATNALIRLPLVLPPFSFAWSVVLRDVAIGIATFYPAALVMYGVILLLAHRAWERTSAAEAPATTRPPERVVVREWNRVHLVRPDEIHWVEADDNYVVVHAGERTYKGRGRIGDLESQLDAHTFVRIHRSAIVRVESIREVQPLTKGDLAVILRDGKVLRVSRARRTKLESALRVQI